MSSIDEILEANESYADSFSLSGLPIPPARKLAVVACMDARLMVDQALGLQAGDAHIIRNAGGIVTEDVLRSLILSHHLLGIEEVMVVNHTDCGMLKFHDEELRDRLREATGADSETPERFHAFSDLQENVRRQIQHVKSHPWIPNRISVRGFVYDVQTGRLGEISA